MLREKKKKKKDYFYNALVICFHDNLVSGEIYNYYNLGH